MKSISRIHADTIAAAAQPAARSTPWTLIESLAVFGVCMALFAFIQFGTSALADNDAYYHVKMGWLIRQQGLTPQFIWLPHTILRAEAFYDHHMLYHVYLSLFTGDGQEQTMAEPAANLLHVYPRPPAPAVYLCASRWKYTALSYHGLSRCARR
jgi:hypothetical protein